MIWRKFDWEIWFTVIVVLLWSKPFVIEPLVIDKLLSAGVVVRVVGLSSEAVKYILIIS